MSHTIFKEISLPQSPEQVWSAISNREALAEWMYPNDFEPHVGHRFCFQVPPKPEVNFEGLTVRCEVLECDPPNQLSFSWSAGGPVENTQVSFRLEPDGEGTRLFLAHSGFDLDHPFGKPAFAGAGYGWDGMLGKLTVVAAGRMSGDS